MTASTESYLRPVRKPVTQFAVDQCSPLSTPHADSDGTLFPDLASSRSEDVLVSLKAGNIFIKKLF